MGEKRATEKQKSISHSRTKGKREKERKTGGGREKRCLLQDRPDKKTGRGRKKGR